MATISVANWGAFDDPIGRQIALGQDAGIADGAANRGDDVAGDGAAVKNAMARRVSAKGLLVTTSPAFKG